VILVRGSLIPVIRLNELFDIEADHSRPWESLVVVVEGDGRRNCLMVDELLGKQEVVIKNLGGGLNGSKGISGAAILGDGRVGLILDIPGICEMVAVPAH
jgi:two-component system chemotaxis sensor kinase CheA